jgi:hypothetical protein
MAGRRTPVHPSAAMQIVLLLLRQGGLRDETIRRTRIRSGICWSGGMTAASRAS